MKPETIHRSKPITRAEAVAILLRIRLQLGQMPIHIALPEGEGRESPGGRPPL